MVNAQKSIILIIVFFVSSFVYAEQMIHDPNITKGFKENTNHTIGPQCSFPVTSGPSKWHINEIASTSHFCSNSANQPNTQISSRTNLQSSNNGATKSFNLSGGVGRMKYNTYLEGVEGCNLKTEPNGDPTTNWPHYLLANTLLGNGNTKTELNLKHPFTFSAQFKLNKLTTLGGECNSKAPQYHYGGTPNHALFYVGLVLVNKQYNTLVAPGRDKIYLVVSIVFGGSNGGGNLSTPALGNDQLPQANPVYTTAIQEYGNIPNNQWKTVTFDVNKVTQQALDKIYKVHGDYRQLNDYFVGELYVGWEIWGGYDTDIEFKNVSLQKSNSNVYSNLHRYWKSSISDHYYTTDYIPGGFLGYTYEGNIGKLSKNQPDGTKPLAQFYSVTNADHAYSTSPTQSPGSGYEFEKILGFLSPLNTGIKLYEYWEPNIHDHFYTHQYAPGGISSWQYIKRLPGDLKN